MLQHDRSARHHEFQKKKRGVTELAKTMFDCRGMELNRMRMSVIMTSNREIVEVISLLKYMQPCYAANKEDVLAECNIYFMDISKYVTVAKTTLQYNALHELGFVKNIYLHNVKVDVTCYTYDQIRFLIEILEHIQGCFTHKD